LWLPVPSARDYVRVLRELGKPGGIITCAQPEQVQLTEPERVGLAGSSAAAFVKVKVPEPLALMVTDTVAYGASGL
jgi:hypothetical protein